MTDREIIEQNRIELAELLKLKPFRRLMKRLILNCRVGQNGYVKDSFDGTAFNLGQMSIGNMVVEWIMDADRKALPLMHDEYTQEVEEYLRSKKEQEGNVI